MNKLTQEALKMAHKTFMQLNERSPRKEDGSGYFDKEINACKKALKQPEGKEFFERGKEIARWADKPAQEPVAYNFEGVLFFANEASHYMKDSGQPLYTHPHQVVPTSTWQGLDAVEVSNIFISKKVNGDATQFARAIEQALKEKNHG